MRLESLSTRRSIDAWTRVAVACWALVLVVLGVRCALKPTTRTLYPVYAAAGTDWRVGSDQLYHRTGENGEFDFFRYSPPVAVALTPWSFLPLGLGGILWRLFNAGVFLAGTWWWLRSAAPGVLSERRQAFFFLLVLPLSLSSLGNGQVNPLVIGFLLASMAAAADERWWSAAVCVGLATALKIYPLAVGLLLAACYPRQFAGRLAVVIVTLAALPFGFQNPAYVVNQYREWFGALAIDDRRYWPLHMTYRDLWLLFRVCGVGISPAIYQMIQVLGGAACAAVCVALRWTGRDRCEVLSAVLGLGCCWMMLLGPATESASYVILAPTLAWVMLAAKSAATRGLALAAAALLFVCVLAGLRPGTGAFHGRGLHPLGALFCTAAVLWELRRDPARSAGMRIDDGVKPLAA